MKLKVNPQEAPVRRSFLHLHKFAAAISIWAMLQGDSSASVVLTATGDHVRGGEYILQEFPGFGNVHIVQTTSMTVLNNYQSNIFVWSFGYLYFDVSGQTEEVDRAILTMEIKGAAGSGGNTDTPASFDIYNLTASFHDTDGIDDGDFGDYDALPDGPHYEGGSPPNYTAVSGVPDKATAWYESQFGTATIPIPSVATLTFEGNDVGDFGSVDITGLVNDWISGRVENHGMGLLLVAPDVYRISIEDGNNLNRSNPTLTLSQVPEPASTLLVAVASLAGLGVRRRGLKA